MDLSTPDQSAAPEIVDLDSLEKFKFGGKEWNPKDLQNSHMMHSDYTRKTQAIAEERKYYDNLSADLAAVRVDPTLSSKFKQVYPEKFHNFLTYAIQEQRQEQAQFNPGAEKYQSVDPSLMKDIQTLKAKFQDQEKQAHEQRVTAIEAELDAKFKTYADTYPMADEEAVLARAQYAISQGNKMTDKTWDAIWKSVHDTNQSKADAYYSKRVKEQTNANSKLRDIGPGGGTPGQAPQNARTIREAGDFARKNLGQL